MAPLSQWIVFQDASPLNPPIAVRVRRGRKRKVMHKLGIERGSPKPNALFTKPSFISPPHLKDYLRYVFSSPPCNLFVVCHYNAELFLVVESNTWGD